MMNHLPHFRRVALLAIFLTTATVLCAQTDPGRYPLIPYPASLVPAPGSFEIAFARWQSAPKFVNEQAFLQKLLNQYLGRPGNKRGVNLILLKEDASITNPAGYHLSIQPHRMVLSASSRAGMFYALETLRQLLPAAVENDHGSSLTVPCVEISDHPAYAWRGMMLDVSRHFFTVEYVKKFIDRMALYKFNKLHLHLTDDQGWRIQIKKYPLLTEKSAWRSFNDQDSACMKLARDSSNPDFLIDPTHIRQTPKGPQYGGFYTREQLRDIIRYAAARHIEIIPEIDMPGHMMAAILLYPWLTSEGNTGGDWRNGFTSPICPCKDSTLQFAKDIFGEIADLFPSKFIHIGGDEVDKSHWTNSELCRRFMTAHHIANVDQLQAWFNNYMQAFFHSRGKTLVGWDEIVDGGIDKSAIVMFWRTWVRQAPHRAALNGNKVVMSADGPLYFDAWPDKNSLSAVYHYNPNDTAYHMSPEEQKNIIGLQANLWTERVPSESRADYLVMPRMTALAELAWTHKDLWADYLQRLQRQYERLDRFPSPTSIATVGQPLPPWQEGYLDLHHINTGRGNAAFYILPDGTSVLFDAGELDPTDPRTTSKRNTPIRPNDSRHPYEWVASYISAVAPRKTAIDYAVISHFHEDHFGSWYPSAPLSADKKIALTGITGVADLIPIHTLITRDYHYPIDPTVLLQPFPKDNHLVKTWSNYLAFLSDSSARGMHLQYLKAGSRTQIRLLTNPKAYPDFYVQNVKSNGWIWTGHDSSVEQHFPPIDTADKKTWPDENPLSNVLLIHYGPFTYYTGGDCPGNVFPGDAPWRDVETPVARAVGEVDIATMDHHGNRDAVNEFLVKTLRPRVWIEQVWTADHPGHEVLIRAVSPFLYPGPRDLFATNFMEASELVIGPLVAQSYRSRQGHIVVRVLPGGASYYIIILDDSSIPMTVKSVFGPYVSKGTTRP